jgi:hypothetical protein
MSESKYTYDPLILFGLTQESGEVCSITDSCFTLGSTSPAAKHATAATIDMEQMHAVPGSQCNSGVKYP